MNSNYLSQLRHVCSGVRQLSCRQLFAVLRVLVRRLCLLVLLQCSILTSTNISDTLAVFSTDFEKILTMGFKFIILFFLVPVQVFAFITNHTNNSHSFALSFNKATNSSYNVSIHLQNNSDSNSLDTIISEIIVKILVQNNTLLMLNGKVLVVNITSTSSVNETIYLQPGPVVWRENRPPGTITALVAKDYDGPENGEPFRFQISSSASPEIQSKFGISGKSNSSFNRLCSVLDI